MQTNKILVLLLLCAAITLSQYTLAASFCATTPEGKIRVDDCNYSTYDECKHANVNQGDCVADDLDDKLAASTVAPYCIVTWSTECKYFDYDKCTQTAASQKGFCYQNPDFKKPDK